jgi:hypothetical protein
MRAAAIAFIVFFALSCSEGAHPLDAPKRRVAIFDAQSVWNGDDGGTLKGLGYPMMALYAVDSSGRRTTLPIPDSCYFRSIAVSPRGDRVAYAAHFAGTPATPAQRAVTGVHVVDDQGRAIERFSACWAPCWSSDGTRLAMIEGAFPETLGWLGTTGVRVSDLSGHTRRLNFRPLRLGWGNGDTLYLGFHDGRNDQFDRVVAVDVATGRSWLTAYVGIEVSPDGRYSMQDGWGLVLKERDTELHLGAALANHDRVEARWLRASPRGHLLCLSTFPYKGGSHQQGLRTIVLDPWKMDTLIAFDGKLVTITNDERAVVLLRGDTLAIEDLPSWPAEPVARAAGKVRMEIYRWGGFGRAEDVAPKLWRDTTVTISEGDWLLRHARIRPGSISPPERWFRVLRANDAPGVEVECALHWIEIPVGDGPSPSSERSRLAPGDRFTLSATPRRFRTPTIDGGEDVILRLVP